MNLMDSLANRWDNKNHPALIIEGSSITFEQIQVSDSTHLAKINRGDVVALIGDFDVQSIANLINLIDKGAVVVPLSPLTSEDHNYFFLAAGVKWIIQNNEVRYCSNNSNSELINKLIDRGSSGLVLFSTGTTGRPKAILHDFTLFISRFYTPRPNLRTLAFLLFDHIGGLNTLFHTLFNNGTVICTKNRDMNKIIELCNEFDVELLPTTPTFLRLMLISGIIPEKIPKALKVITYGTERMDEVTLETLCKLLPDIDFRQTYGLSELGILRVKSKSRDSLYMKIGGEGVQWKVEKNLLLLKSQASMLGYLNSETPFDNDGWYQTNDLVEVDGDFIKIVGRNIDVVNVGGLKFLLSDVERVAYANSEIELAKVVSKPNPITGQHVEILVQLAEGSNLDETGLQQYFSDALAAHMRPRRIEITKVKVGHRYKKI
jgi:long-chain acyl-CoA synthetase